MGQLINNQSTNIINSSSNDMFDVMEKAYKFSQIMAKSDIIPMHYRDKPENVFIAIQTAHRMNLDPMHIMQNTFVIGGKLGMNSTFAISLANRSGLLTNGIRYKIVGEDNALRVTAYATLKSNNEEISFTIGMKEAIAENWTKNPKYKSLPELMLRYRAATLLIKTHIPEVINGMHMVEELEDVAATQKNIAPKLDLISKIDKFLSASDISEAIVETQEEKITEVQQEEILESNYDQLKILIDLHDVSESVINTWLEKANVEQLDQLSDDRILKCIDYIENKYQIRE